MHNTCSLEKLTPSVVLTAGILLTQSAAAYALPPSSPSESVRMDVRPQICERGTRSKHCHLQFTIHSEGLQKELCLYMDDGKEVLLACKSGQKNWQHEVDLLLTRTTRFFLREGTEALTQGEVRVELASYVPAVRPRRRHAWFSF
ncbi:MAG: DUF3019 domain-containing protein [Gammaproteobacteria bacterium]|nr:DUF3019 domain-containing protein [Gammaproteobacteria bacterium]